MHKLILFILAICLFSCSANYEVTLKKNGTARVHYTFRLSIPDSLNYLYPADLIDKNLDTLKNIFDAHYKNKQISAYRYKLTNVRQIDVDFKIKNINQLGNFMVPQNSSEWFQFAHHKGKLVITCKSQKGEKPEIENEFAQQLSFSMKLTLPSEIKKVEAQTQMKVKYAGKELLILSDMTQMGFSESDTRIEIYY